MLKSLIKTSWQIVWQNPILWIFGFFSTILTGNEISFVVNNFQNFSNSFNNNSVLTQITGFNFSSTPLRWWGLLLIIVFFLILLFLVVWSQVGLILGAKQQTSGARPNFKEIMKRIGHYFLPSFLINFAALIIVYVVFAVIRVSLVSLVYSNHLIWPVLYFFINLILFIPISLIVYFLARFAVINLVLTDDPFMASLKKSWKFLFKSWLTVLILVVVWGLIGFVFGLILFVLSSTTAAPFVILVALTSLLKFNMSFPLVLGIILFLIGIIFVFLEALFFSWQNTSWILFYLGKKSGQKTS